MIAVKAVLMTYEYDPKLNAYHRESCKAVSDLAHVLVSWFQDLRETGHPKWKEVDLNDLPPGWNVSECVNAGLDPSYTMECDQKEPAAEGAGSEANAAYRQSICSVIGC